MSSSMVTEGMIDAIYDALAVMSMFTQRLADGEVSQNEGTDMSWILGSTKRRLEPILSVLEHIQAEQQRTFSPADYINGLIDGTKAELDLLSEISAVTAKFQRIRQEREGAKS